MDKKICVIRVICGSKTQPQLYPIEQTGRIESIGLRKEAGIAVVWEWVIVVCIMIGLCSATYVFAHESEWMSVAESGTRRCCPQEVVRNNMAPCIEVLERLCIE